MDTNLAKDTPLEVAAFVSSFYKLYGARINTVGKALEIILEDHVAKQLDGPWARGYRLLFVFKEEDLKGLEEAELVSLGSYRLHYLLSLAKRKGRFTRIALAPEAVGTNNRLPSHEGRWYKLSSSVVYIPHLALTFSCAYQGDQRWEEMHSFVLNRVSKEVMPLNWPHLLPFIQQTETLRTTELVKAKISLKKAYHKLEEAAIQEILAKDYSWSSQALSRLEKEKEDLDEFFAKLSAEETLKDPEATGEIQERRRLRLKEQEDRFGPKVFFRPIQTALIAVPERSTIYLCSQAGKEKKVVEVATPFSSQVKDLPFEEG